MDEDKEQTSVRFLVNLEILYVCILLTLLTFWSIQPKCPQTHFLAVGIYCFETWC